MHSYNNLIYTLATCLSLTSAAPTANLIQSIQNFTSFFTIELTNPDENQAPSANVPVQHVLQMSRKTGAQPVALSYLNSLRAGPQQGGVFGQQEVDITDTGLVFAVEVDIGGTKYELVLDTGSADTWLPKSNYQCVAVGSGDFRPQSDCALASTYVQSSNYRPVDNENFYVQYSDGESLKGTFGLETITVAGIEVPQQQFGLVDTAAWIGDGATSGLLGLAFPAATKAFKGTNFQADTPDNQVPYDPIFTSMYNREDVAPMFSIALDRNTGGQIAFGGLPNGVDHFPVFSSAPFQLLTTSGSGQLGTASSKTYTLYTITVKGFTYGGKAAATPSYQANLNRFAAPTDPTSTQVIVDTATVNIFLPPTTADSINALFSPKPFYRNNAGLYVVSCTATPPRFGVKIGVENFYVNANDMIVNLNGQCVSAVAATGEGGTSILGEAFLRNVLAVFDVGAQEMRFAAREYY